MTDPPPAITDTIDVIVAKIRARADQEIAEAVAAEREACAQLAEQVGAGYVLSNDAGLPFDFKPFAALLREDTHDDRR